MKHLKPLKLNESAQNEFANVITGGIVVGNKKIDLEERVYCDDDIIQYDLFITGDDLLKLFKIGVKFEDLDYSDSDHAYVNLYTVSRTVSENTLIKRYGVYGTGELKDADAHDLIMPKVKFKFKQSFTPENFVKYVNRASSDSDYKAVLTTNANKEMLDINKEKALNQFLGTLTQKDYYLLGKSEDYFTTLPSYAAIAKLKIPLEVVINHCLTAVGVKAWEKSNKLVKANSAMGILDE